MFTQLTLPHPGVLCCYMLQSMIIDVMIFKALLIQLNLTSEKAEILSDKSNPTRNTFPRPNKNRIVIIASQSWKQDTKISKHS